MFPYAGCSQPIMHCLNDTGSWRNKYCKDQNQSKLLSGLASGGLGTGLFIIKKGDYRDRANQNDQL